MGGYIGVNKRPWMSYILFLRKTIILYLGVRVCACVRVRACVCMRARARVFAYGMEIMKIMISKGCERDVIINFKIIQQSKIMILAKGSMDTTRDHPTTQFDISIKLSAPFVLTQRENSHFIFHNKFHQ